MTYLYSPRRKGCLRHIVGPCAQVVDGYVAPGNYDVLCGFDWAMSEKPDEEPIKDCSRCFHKRGLMTTEEKRQRRRCGSLLKVSRPRE